jgi:cytochrome c oxidase assembly protein subunit 15
MKTGWKRLMDLNLNAALVRAPGEGPAPEPNIAVRVWLFSVAALILIMVVVGGATRLTGSGLSITEWRPILGAIPPLSESGWQEAFHKYQQIPQFKIVNRAMTLSEFKGIYWWEWAHRFLGRFIGVAFLAPFILFWRRGAIPRALLPKLGGIFLLGALQGAIGWFMVASGLVERVSVSPTWLAAHLGMAVAVTGAILWVAFDLGRETHRGLRKTAAASQTVALILLGLVYLQILAGGLVAGLSAGLGYNTWPLMDGSLVPEGLGALQPWYINLFENALTVQFDHRMLAYAIAALALVNALVTPAPLRASALLLLLAVAGQITLGILTLLSYVPFDLALSHQSGAMLVFVLALYHAHRVRSR